MKIKFFITIAFIVFGLGAIAQQTDCSIKLEQAERLFEEGILDSIPTMLRVCVNDGFDDEELSRAYKLLILTYLFEDYQEMAELTMMKFLKKFPEYVIKTTDPIEFTYLYKSYETIPTFSIGIIGGINYTYTRFIEPFSTNGMSSEFNGEYSSSGSPFHVGLQLKKYINDQIEINLDILYANKAFDLTITGTSYKTQYTEYQSMISFPLTGTYDFNLNYKGVNPYVRLGVNYDYLITSTADFELNNLEGGNIDKDKGVDISGSRSSYNISVVLGGGLKYTVKRGYFILDARYHYSIINNFNGKPLGDDYEILFNYYYNDISNSLNNLFISAGYVFPFYKTKQN